MSVTRHWVFQILRKQGGTGTKSLVCFSHLHDMDIQGKNLKIVLLVDVKLIKNSD